MAQLSAARRRQLPRSSFGLPGSRRYPMPDRRHAAVAKARATQMYRRGKLSRTSMQRVHAKANRVLARGRPSYRRSGGRRR